MAKSFSELYEEAKPLIDKIFANDLRIRIILALDEKAKFLNEITAFVEASEPGVKRELAELEKAGVVKCTDEIYSLTRNLGEPSARVIKHMNLRDDKV